MANPLYDRLLGVHAGRQDVLLHVPGRGDWSYDAFLRRAAQLAHTLVAMNLVPGDRVAIQVDKSPEALALIAACVQAGVILLPLNTAYTVAELTYFVENSGARLVVAADAARDGIAAATGVRVETLNADGGGTLMAAADSQPDMFETVARGDDELAAFLYTSGTTGRSKGAMLSQANLLSNAETLADYWRFTADDVLLHALPIFHTHGLFVACNVTLLAGGSMVFLPKFDLDAMIAAMPSCTTLMGVPTFYTRLLDDPRFDRDLVAHMRLFVSGSAPLLAETHERFEARTKHRILERYGMTETNMNTSNPYQGDRRAGTVGLPLPGVELRVCDAQGTEVPVGEIGMIEVRGPNVFQGYWQMPEKTAAELRDNGFFITGDLGHVDADGYVTIVGRGKDLIISGGLNIYPKEVETVLDDVPGVMESAVIGLPDADFGEAVLGVLVPETGVELDPEAVMADVRDKLARFKHPRRLEVVPALPRNTMGKVQKNVLRDMFG